MKKSLFLTITLFQLLVTSSLFLSASPVDALSCAPAFHKIGIVKTIDEEAVTLERIYAYGMDQDQGDPFSSTLFESPVVFKIDLYEKIVNAYLTLPPQSSKLILAPEYIIEEGTITFTPIEETEDWSQEKVYIHQTRDRKISWGVGDILVVGGTVCSCGYSLKGVFTSQGEVKTILLDTPLTTYSYRGTSITPTAVNYDLNNVKFRVGDEEFSLKSGESFSPKSKFVELVTLNSTQGGCWGQESVSFDLVLQDGGSEMPIPSPIPQSPYPLPPQPKSPLILVFMLLAGVATIGILFIFFRKGRSTNFLKEFRTEIKIALIGMGILAGVISLLIALYFPQKVLYPVENIPPKDGVFEGVPTTYTECIRADKKYNAHEEVELKCGYYVSADEELEKYQKCLNGGGKKITKIFDTFDPENPPSTSNDCKMIFYNQNFEFPKNFKECENEKKGAIIGGDGSTQGGVLRPKTCLVSVDVEEATNKEIAYSLLKECRALGGDYNERIPSCLIEFNEPDSTVKVSEARECRELVVGHNKPQDNRIDLVLIGFDYTSLEKFVETAQAAIDFEGGDKGLFSLQPFKSNQNKFNIWYVASLGDSKNQAEDNWELSSICREKLDLTNHEFTRKDHLFSDKMFTLFLVNEDAQWSDAGYFYSLNPRTYTCTPQDDNGLCGLKGIRISMAEDGTGRTISLNNFLHEFAHVFTMQNFYFEHRPAEYYNVLDEYIRFDEPYPAREYKNVVKDHSNCFVGTYEQCISSQNNKRFGDMIGDGCGKDGVIDCCTNDETAIKEGALSCAECPTCKKDPRYDLEIACYESCWAKSGIYRSTLNSLMSSRTGSQEYGKLNEKILCHQIQLLTGKVGGICK